MPAAANASVAPSSRSTMVNTRTTLPPASFTASTALIAEPPLPGTDVVLVNDGSRDGSHRECLACCDRHPGRVTYLRLARNFGEHGAVMAGLCQSGGDYVVVARVAARTASNAQLVEAWHRLLQRAGALPHPGGTGTMPAIQPSQSPTSPSSTPTSTPDA